MPDATITSTASTFGTISGTFAADQSTVTGTVSSIITGTLSGSVGVPGPVGPAGPEGPEGPPGPPGPGSTWGTITGTLSSQTDLQNALNAKYDASNPSGFITSAALAGYATESWVTAGFYPLTGNPSGFLTASSLTPYLTKADNLGSLTNFATARSNLSLGTLNTPVFAGVTAQGSGSNVANLTPSALSITHSTFGNFTIQPSSGITFPDSTVQTTAFTVAQLSNYLAKASNLSDLPSTSTARSNLGLGSLAIVNDAPSDGSQYARKNGAWDVVTATSSYITSVSSPLSVTSGNLTIDLSAYAQLASPVFTGDARAVTPAFGDNDTSIATTAFVQSALLGGTAVARNLEVEVRNKSGSTIAAGSIVYISGATGNKPLITLAQANNDANSAQTIGFVKTSIANNGTGFVIVRGELENIDTSALTEGVQLYLSPTTAGTWTTTKPSAPQHLVYVGIVIRSHPTQGTILVAVQNGYELGEIHDVALSGLANNDLLAYESSTDLWKNKSFGTLGLLTSADAASTYISKSGSTINANAVITFPVGTSSTTNAVSNQGILIRDASNVPLARFYDNEVLIPSVGITFSDATVQTTAGLSPTTAASTYYLQTNPAGYITSAALSGYAPLASPALTGNVTITSNSTGAALFIQQSGTGNILTLHDQASDTTFVAIDQNGKVNTIASEATNGAGFNIPHGTAPTTPVNGDIWTTTSGLLARINGSTRQYVDLDGTQTINGAKTFSGANQTLGNSTTAGTINIGTGAVATGAKQINIGTGSTGGSVVITFGTAAMTGNTVFNGGGQFQVNNNTVNIGTNTATSSATFAGGATISGSTKTVAIGSGGVAGSTTNINLGTVDGGAATVTTNALLVTRASATTGSGLRVPHGAAPTSPTNGDIWTETTGVFARINGATQTLTPPTAATVAEAKLGNDTAKFINCNILQKVVNSPSYYKFPRGIMSTSTSGTGAAVTAGALLTNLVGTTTGAGGALHRYYGFSGVDIVNGTGYTVNTTTYGINFGKQMRVTGSTRVALGTNSIVRVSFGKNANQGVGDPNQRAIGWRYNQATGFIEIVAHNGTSIVTLTTASNPVASGWFEWELYSNGAGSVQMFVNDVSIGTLTGGPTTFDFGSAPTYVEEVECTATPSAQPNALFRNGGVFLQP